MSAHSENPGNRLEKVLALDGPEFLAQAYLLMLGRPVDPQGFRNYSALLASGISKLSILTELRASEESQARGIDTPDPLSLLQPTQEGIRNMRSGPNSVAASIQELLVLDDVVFVDSAYRTLLRRAPDASGFSNYLQLVRSGASKMRIVSQLCSSAEGRAAAPPLPGLRGAMRRYRLANSWLTGWWYRPMAQFEGDTPFECRLRAIENALMRMLQQRERESSDLDNSVDDVARLLKALADRQSA